jgi:hypothetical protein
MASIAQLVDNLTEAFVSLAIAGIIVVVVFGLDVAGTNDSTLLTDLETEINNGMVTVAGVVVLIAVIFVLRMLRGRA